MESGAPEGESPSGDAPAIAQTAGDPELSALVAAWPDLPPAMRTAIVALVRSARPDTPLIVRDR